MANVAAVPIAGARVNHFKQAMLSLFSFGTNMQWAAILLITLPKQAFLIGGDAVKGQTLGTVLLRIIGPTRRSRQGAAVSEITVMPTGNALDPVLISRP